MRLLVTGSDGQVGTELKRQSSEYDFEIFHTDKEEMDITSYDDVINYFSENQPDLLVNLAAYTNVEKAEDEREAAYQINVEGPKNLAQACKNKSIPIIHISTDYVFNGKKDSPYTEEDEPDPINFYGETKFRGEEKIKELLPQHIIIRTSWLFSHHMGHNFIKQILNRANSNERIQVVNDIFGCPTSARSLAECIFRICEQYRNSGRIDFGTYHFVNSPPSSWHVFATHIVDLAYENKIINQPIFVHPVPSSHYETNAVRPINSTMSAKKISSCYQIPDVNWRSELIEIMKEIT
ncbi:MAG: dTDP-4-dehydrorhamnose reductase [Gammaproteobacteria bacterium]|nr:dTDP-4-dehydrorhamnose reductase [Gammaproteobacteria bacterium]